MPHTILLADDSKTIRRVVEIAFEKEPFEVVAVADGEAAVAKAQELQPAVVLADHHMPGKTGYEVAEALKQNPATAGIPVLMLSGSSAPFDEARCSSSGAVGFLQKPFDCQSLIDKVSELVGGVSDAERQAAAQASNPPTSAAAAGLPRPPGPGGGPPRPMAPTPAPTPPAPRTQELSSIGFTSTPVGAASPFGGSDDASISIDLGPGESLPAEKPVAPAPAAAAPLGLSSGAASAVSSQAAPAVAAGLAAQGIPTTDAITAATREIIEKVVWEVVPELAETLIREEIDRLLKQRAG